LTGAAGAPGALAPRRRLGLALWLAGMPGVIAVSLATPALLAASPAATAPPPPGALVAAGIAQGALLLALAVAVGVRLAPRVGWSSPVAEAACAGRRPDATTRAGLLVGLRDGLACGVLLHAVLRLAPDGLARGADALPLHARVLYGGVTEELLLRWGATTACAWALHRTLQRGAGPLAPRLARTAIVVGALLFGIAHLPAAAAAAGGLDAALVAWTVGANAAFGVAFGRLFARHGLESAMIAHGGAHAIAWVLDAVNG